jgi:hypothetical protein
MEVSQYHRSALQVQILHPCVCKMRYDPSYNFEHETEDEEDFIKWVHCVAVCQARWFSSTVYFFAIFSVSFRYRKSLETILTNLTQLVWS